MTARRRHVCMIAYTNYAFDARVRREAETLAAQGFAVRCLTTANGHGPREFALEGVEVRELAVPKYRGKNQAAYIASYLRFLLHSSTACLRLLARRELDVVHVHNMPDFLVFAALLPRLAGKKVVLDVHDSMPETFATKFSRASALMALLRLEERLSAAVAHKVICVNHPQRDTLVARGIPGAKTFISMNVPDPRIFVRGGHERQGAAEPEQFNLVYHGTMSERLGVDLVIEAVARLRDRIPGLRLHLWGDGDDRETFEQLVRAKRLEGQVFFKPKGVPLAELPQHLRHMDAGVVGNRSTAAGELMLPVKLLECVSLGLPVVAPRLKAIQHYFSSEMVSYFTPGDVESLVAAIDQLYTERARRARQVEHAGRFLDQYGWERQGPELVTLYRTLVEN